MNIEQVHIPQRLDGESMEQYRARQRMSKRLAQRTTLLHNSLKGVFKSKANQYRKKLIKALGIRQAKKAMRVARAQQLQAGY